ncbi:MAG: tRNA guanosine(34) transglycosylase Tgt [bacterium]|nr:tRNA guanosine(34) transglycosylase Tgt [bacterium]
MKTFSFNVIAHDKTTSARVGEIVTPHGVIQTPAFVPVGTQGTVKTLTPDELNDLGVELFFVNTYHAYLRPGIEVIKKFGGLHRFIGWDKPLVTDSGGFQVFSLGAKKYVNVALSESAVLDPETFTKKMTKREAGEHHVYPDDYRPIGQLVKIDEDGVTFTSHWDGSPHRFTPERSIEIQHALGADIILAFDECAPHPATHQYTNAAMERTHRWALRSQIAHKAHAARRRATGTAHQALYGVIQGGIYRDLREKSAKIIGFMDFDGIAIGGVSVGETKKEMSTVLDWVIPELPREKPLHLLGVGEIDDIFTAIKRGVDTFDCVQPTRLARMGQVFTSEKLRVKSSTFVVDITKSVYAHDINPIDKDCTCYTCKNFSRAYVHHLFRVRELLGYRLSTIHNIHFICALVSAIRDAIKAGTLLDLEKRYLLQ